MSKNRYYKISPLQAVSILSTDNIIEAVRELKADDGSIHKTIWIAHKEYIIDMFLIFQNNIAFSIEAVNNGDVNAIMFKKCSEVYFIPVNERRARLLAKTTSIGYLTYQKNTNTMTVQDLINANVATLAEVIDYLEGVGNWKQTRKDIEAHTGFAFNIDINTDDDYTNEEVLNAEVLENDIVF